MVRFIILCWILYFAWAFVRDRRAERALRNAPDQNAFPAPVWDLFDSPPLRDYGREKRRQWLHQQRVDSYLAEIEEQRDDWQTRIGREIARTHSCK